MPRGKEGREWSVGDLISVWAMADTPLHSHEHLKHHAEILQLLERDKALEKPHHFVSVYESVLIPRLYSG